MYSSVSHDAFHSRQKCLVDEIEITKALLSGDPQDQLVIAYNLVIDNKRIADEAEKLHISDFYVASSPPTEGFMVVSPQLLWGRAVGFKSATSLGLIGWWHS